MGTPSATTPSPADFPARLDREAEARLLRLAAARPRDPEAWKAAGPAFFMAGLAVMLASVQGEDRPGLLALAEQLHPGSSRPEVFSRWLRHTPTRPSRFLPMMEMEKRRLIPTATGPCRPGG